MCLYALYPIKLERPKRIQVNTFTYYYLPASTHATKVKLFTNKLRVV